MGQENQGLGVPTLSIAAKPRLAVTLRKVLSPAQRVDQPHLIYGPALCLQKPWRSDNDREALRPRDRDVQPVAGVEELDPPGQVVTGDVAIEISTTAASWPWNLSTVPT